MSNKKRRNFLISAVLILLAIGFTILVIGITAIRIYLKFKMVK